MSILKKRKEKLQEEIIQLNEDLEETKKLTAEEKAALQKEIADLESAKKELEKNLASAGAIGDKPAAAKYTPEERDAKTKEILASIHKK